MSKDQHHPDEARKRWDTLEWDFGDGVVVRAHNNGDGTFTIKDSTGAEHTIPFCNHTAEEDEKILESGVYA